MIAAQGTVMSLTIKVINRRKLKEPSKAQGKNLTDLIRRNKIFSRPGYKDHQCPPKKGAINGTIKMDVGRR